MTGSVVVIRLGVLILPEHRWSDARALWVRAEELGFDHAWTYDHLAWRSLRDEPWFSALPTLVAAAIVTSHIRIGPLVASPNFRHPVSFARELLALDDISNGRVTLGIGAGGAGWDASMLGHAPWSPTERSGRFREFVVLLDRLLRDPVTSFEGEYYSADGARSHPGSVQQPHMPFAVAASGPRGMRLAVEHGSTWVTTGDRKSGGPVDARTGARIVGEQIARLDEVCHETDRDPGTLARLVLVGPELSTGLESPDAFLEVVGRYADAGITDLVVPWPRASEPYTGDVAAFEAAVLAARAAD